MSKNPDEIFIEYLQLLRDHLVSRKYSKEEVLWSLSLNKYTINATIAALIVEELDQEEPEIPGGWPPDG